MAPDDFIPDEPATVAPAKMAAKPSAFVPDPEYRVPGPTFAPKFDPSAGTIRDPVSRAVPYPASESWAKTGVHAAENLGLWPAMTMGGAAAGGALTGGNPLGAAGGAGAGAVGADYLSGAINQRLFGDEFKPSAIGTGLAFGLGALNPFLPEALGAAQGLTPSGLAAGAKTAAGETAQSAGERAVQELYKKTLPEATAEYGEAIDKSTLKYQKALGKAEPKLQAKALQKAIPITAQEELQTFIGRTPEQSAASMAVAPVTPEPGVAVAAPDFVERQNRFYDAVFGPTRRMQSYLGKQYDTILRNVRDNKVDPSPLHDVLSKEEDYAKQKGGAFQFSLGARALIKDAQDVAPRSFLDTARAKVAGPLNKTTLERLKDAPEIEPRIDALLTLRSKAQALMSSAKNGPDRHLAHAITEGVDDTLANAKDLPPDTLMRLKGLNAQYRTHKRIFDPSFFRAAATTSEPRDFASSIFEQPQVALHLSAAATPAEKTTLRELFGDYALKVGPDKLADKVQPKVMTSLFGDTPYARVKPWLDVDPNTMSWEQYMNAASPQAQQRLQNTFSDSYAAELKNIQTDRAGRVGDAAVKLAQKLGPAGRGILYRLRQAKDPIARAQVAQSEFQPILSGIPSPVPEPAEKAAFTAFRQNKAIQQGLDLNKTREVAGVTALQRLGKGDPEIVGLNRRFKFYGPVLAAESVTGHASPYLLAATAYSLGGKYLFKPRDAFLRSLEDETTSTEFYRAIGMKPSAVTAPNYARKMGMITARIAAGTATGMAVRGLGMSADVPPDEEGD